MYNLLITNTTVVDPQGDTPLILPAHDIAISGNRIAAVQPTGSIAPAEAAQVIAGAGMAALPGLVNTHAHAAMVLYRGSAEDVDVNTWFNDYIWKMEPNATPDDIHWGVSLAVCELIESGVTTVADHYFAMEQIAEVCAQSGLRAHLAPTMFGGDAAHGELEQALTFAARWHGAADGRISAWLGPHSPYICTPDFLRAVAAEAKQSGLGCHIHVSETAAQVQNSLAQHAVTPVRLLEQCGLLDTPLICAHAAHATPEDIAILAQHGAGVAHCPKTFLKLASGIAPVVAMRAAGVAVGLGSDGAASNNTLDILEQMRLAALLQKHELRDATAMPLGAALALATGDGARVLRQADALGRLAPGFLADVILMRLDGAHVQPLHNVAAALVYAARAGDVDTTIVDGRVLMQQRRLLTLDKPQIVREVAARAGRVARRDHARKLQHY